MIPVVQFAAFKLDLIVCKQFQPYFQVYDLPSTTLVTSLTV